MQKLIVFAAVVAIVWYGFKFLGRLQATREAEERLREREAARPSRKSAGEPARERRDAVEDLVPCPNCGAYVRAGTTCSCGRKA